MQYNYQAIQKSTAVFQKKLGKNGVTLQDNRSSTVQQKSKTGLPDHLRNGIEHLSGLSMDDVKVHYNSPKPAQLSAHAYAQGTDIHLGSGQEKHLPHEAWHVVQQKQGRVRPTVRTGGVNINDSIELENEATSKGNQALRHQKSMNKEASETGSQTVQTILKAKQDTTSNSVAQLFKGKRGKLLEGMEEKKDDRDLPIILKESQEALSGKGDDEEPVDWQLNKGFTTKGYELEFARVSGEQEEELEGLSQLMRGATHAEYYASTEKVGGLPIKIEGDAAGKLELVTPPLVVSPKNRVHVFSKWSHMAKRAASKKTLGSAKDQIESETGFAIESKIEGIRSWFADYRHGTGSKGSFKLGAEAGNEEQMKEKVTPAKLAAIQIGPLSGGAGKSKMNIHINEAIKSGNIKKVNFYKAYGAKAKRRKPSHVQYEASRKSIGVNIMKNTKLKMGVKTLIGRQVGSYIVDTALLGSYKELKMATKKQNFEKGQEEGIDGFQDALNVGNLDSNIKDRSKMFLKVAWEDVIMKEIPESKRKVVIEEMQHNAESMKETLTAAASRAANSYWGKPTGKAKTRTTAEQRSKFMADAKGLAEQAIVNVITQLDNLSSLEEGELLENAAEFGEGGGLLAVRPDTLIRPVKSGKNNLYVIEHRGRRLRYSKREQEE